MDLFCLVASLESPTWRPERLLQTRHNYISGKMETFKLFFVNHNTIANVAHCKDSGLGERKQSAGLLPTLCPTAVSEKSGANITNEPLVQTLLINGAERPGHKELTKQTRHAVLLYSFIPSVFSLGRERSVVRVRSMLRWGQLRSIHTATKEKLSGELALECLTRQSQSHIWLFLFFNLSASCKSTTLSMRHSHLALGDFLSSIK